MEAGPKEFTAVFYSLQNWRVSWSWISHSHLSIYVAQTLKNIGGCMSDPPKVVYILRIDVTATTFLENHEQHDFVHLLLLKFERCVTLYAISYWKTCNMCRQFLKDLTRIGVEKLIHLNWGTRYLAWDMLYHLLSWNCWSPSLIKLVERVEPLNMITSLSMFLHQCKSFFVYIFYFVLCFANFAFCSSVLFAWFRCCLTVKVSLQ